MSDYIPHQFEPVITGTVQGKPKVFTFEDGKVKTTFDIRVNGGKNPFSTSKEDKYLPAKYINGVIVWGREGTALQDKDLVRVAAYWKQRAYKDKSGAVKVVEEYVVKTDKTTGRPLLDHAGAAHQSEYYSDEQVAAGKAPVVHVDRGLEITDDDIPF